MGHPTVLVTHSLRIYREALCAWLRHKRPAVSVAECEPAVLDLARARYDPCLIICETPTPTMRREESMLSWIEFHPAGSAGSVVHLPGEDCSDSDLTLSDVLEIIDAAVYAPVRATEPPSSASTA